MHLYGGQGDGWVTRTRAWTVIVICTFFVGGCLTHRLSAVEVARRAQDVLREVNACHYVLDIELDTDLLKDSLSVEVWERYPDRFKVQVRSANSPQLRGLAFTTNGVQSKLYTPDTNEVVVGPPDVVKLPSVIDRLVRAPREWLLAANAGQARLIAREREDGLVVYKVEIPLGSSGRARYWIDVRRWWVRRVIYWDDYLGSGVIQVRDMTCYGDSSPPAEGTLPDEQFELEIPEGVPITELTLEEHRPLTLEEAQMAVSFPLRTPTYLPPDTRFAAAYQLDKNMALFYDGRHAFTLVQGPNIGPVPQEGAETVHLRGRQATLVRDREHGGLLLTWREGELQFSLAGSLERDEAIRIAESLQ